MTLAETILVVDDEANIRLTLTALLRRAGYTVIAAESGAAGLEVLAQQPCALLLIDLKMPEIDGMQVIAAARSVQPDLAIIVLTGHGSLQSAIDGIHYGIFDYILKTSEPAHVVARVGDGLRARAAAQRQRGLLDLIGNAAAELAGHTTDPASVSRTLVLGGLQLDTWQQTARLRGQTLLLTPVEFRLLLCLAAQAGTLVGYRTLVHAAQGHDLDAQEASDLVKPHIRNLRQKLETDPAQPRYILNVRGKGYMLNPLPEDP